MAKKVYVGMSGGVDSSVTAALLKQQGFEVIGVYMKNWSQDLPGFPCPWKDDYQDAKRVAVQLGIDFKMYDFEKQYRQKVVDYMLEEYKAGRTPNPDIMCNQEVKFKLFLNTALEDGADLIATGHYAKTKDGKLYEAVNAEKDQTYFLYRVNEEALKKSLFPIGEFKSKAEVRELAKKINLVTADKKDSQGICFVGKVGIKEFLEQYITTEPGKIFDQNGRIIGEHDGAIFYTIGQRHGLRVGGGLPYYVIGKDMKKNEVYVTTDLDDKKLWHKTLELSEVHWINDRPEPLSLSSKAPSSGEPSRARPWRSAGLRPQTFEESDSGSDDRPSLSRQYQIRTRYHAPLINCRLRTSGKNLSVALDSEVRAVTPGQSAVIYDGDLVLGGGIVI